MRKLKISCTHFATWLSSERYVHCHNNLSTDYGFDQMMISVHISLYSIGSWKPLKLEIWAHLQQHHLMAKSDLNWHEFLYSLYLSPLVSIFIWFVAEIRCVSSHGGASDSTAGSKQSAAEESITFPKSFRFSIQKSTWPRGSGKGTEDLHEYMKTGVGNKSTPSREENAVQESTLLNPRATKIAVWQFCIKICR